MKAKFHFWYCIIHHSASFRILIWVDIMKIVYVSNQYSIYWEFYLSPFNFTFSLNPSNFTIPSHMVSNWITESADSQFCNNSIQHCHPKYSNYIYNHILWRYYKQGHSLWFWFSMQYEATPKHWLILQPYWCQELFECFRSRCVWFNSQSVCLNLPPVLTSTALLMES